MSNPVQLHHSTTPSLHHSNTPSVMARPESVIEDVIRDLPALRDPFGLVEGPVNPEINPALAILLFRL